jgi:hypothetical protein
MTHRSLRNHADPLVKLNSSVEFARRSQFSFGLDFIFHGTEGDQDILTPSNLQQICEIETWITSHPNYPKLCVLNDDGQCKQPELSLVTKFYGAAHNSTCELLPSTDFSITRDMMEAGLDTAAGLLAYGYFMEADAKAKGKTTFTRSTIAIGSPLEGFLSERDRASEQFMKYTALLKPIEQKLFEKFGMEPEGAMAMFSSHYNKKITSPDGKLKVRYHSLPL